MPISVDLGYIIDPLIPVYPLAMDVYETHCAEKHKHPRAQLIYSSEGSMKVVVENSIWLVSPRQAIWVPGWYEHQVYFLKNNHVRNLFFDPSITGNMPGQCFAFNVSPFLRQLIIKVVNNGAAYRTESPENRLIRVLLDELATITPAKHFLPVSSEIHVKKVMDEILDNPGDKRTIEEFADLAYTSSRTLARLFIKEVGLTFSEWRRHVRLMQAVENLEKGASVSQVSFDLGYNSPSAFIEMFRKEFGMSPAKYLHSKSSYIL